MDFRNKAKRPRLSGAVSTAPATRAFDLLEAIGRDCVGAVQLLPPDHEPVGWNRVNVQPLSDPDVERLLRSVTAPSPLGRREDDADEDWLCAQLLREFGLSVADTQMATFGGQKVLVVTRFDRRWVGADEIAAHLSGFVPAKGVWIARLPQEDFWASLPTARMPNVIALTSCSLN